MIEEWKIIPGYDGKYEVSNCGNVRSHKGKTKLLQNKTLNSGYHYVSLTHKCKSLNKTVHRLVAQAFVPNPEDKPFVNHIDGNKINNHAENLEWCTKSENMKHAYRIGLYRNFVPPKVTRKAVLQFKNGEPLKAYPSINEAAKETGASASHISSCCKGYRKTTGGYSWKYQKEGKNE